MHFDPKTPTAKTEAHQLYEGMITGNWAVVRPAIWPKEVLSVYHVSEPQLKSLFDQYVFPELAKNGPEYQVDTLVENHINATWVIKSSRGQTTKNGYSFFLDKGHCTINIQTVLMMTWSTKAYRQTGIVDAPAQIRKDAVFLRSLGWKGLGNRQGKFATWEQVASSMEQQQAENLRERQKALDAYKQ
jgi:hypothetical protein